MKTTVKAYPLYGQDFKLIVHESHTPNYEARLASNLVERWGLVAAEDDGEDSRGAAKLKLMPVEQVVARACETAKLMAEEFHKRGWLSEMPTLEECEDAGKKKERV